MVILGGTSGERAVSLETGKACIKGLRKKKYYELIQNLPIFIPISPIGKNFIKLLDKYPVTPYLDKRKDFIRWVHFIFNHISEQLNEPKEDFYESLEKYYEQYKPKEQSGTYMFEKVDNKLQGKYTNYYLFKLKPRFTGKQTLRNFPLADLVDYLDWGPFFHTWELKGKFPDILENNKYGDQAKILYNDAKALLKEVI